MPSLPPSTHHVAVDLEEEEEEMEEEDEDERRQMGMLCGWNRSVGERRNGEKQK